MPLTRRAIELRDSFFYTDITLTLCYGTWLDGAPDVDIAQSEVHEVGSPQEQSMVWNGVSNDITLKFLLTRSVRANRMVLKRAGETVATFVLPIDQDLLPGTEFEIDGRTIGT